MGSSRRSPWRLKRHGVLLCALSTAAAISFAVTTSVAAQATPPGSSPTPGGSATPVLPTTLPNVTSVTMSDGAVLKALWFAPTTPGLHPLIILPSTWGGGITQMPLGAWKLAQRGYTTVIYSERGFNGSGGQVDIGGPKDMSDFSQVLTWALKNTPSDPGRVGVTSISYGSGIGLLAAATDPRVKAVVSMSGWADLKEAIRPNNATEELDSIGLWTSGWMNGTLSPDANKFLEDLALSNRSDEAWDDQYMAVRSPDQYIAQINKNHPAIMMAQALTDPVFSPNQILPFYDQLTGPKRLELRRGDHAGPEAEGVYALDNIVWDDASRWFDTYLGGPDPSLSPTQQPPVLIEPRTEYGAGANEYYPTSSAWTTATTKLYLTKPSGLLLPTGAAGSTPSTGWADKIHAGLNVITATAGSIPLVSYSLEAATGVPPALQTMLIGRDSSSVWQSPVTPTLLKLRGSPHVHFTVTPARSTGMVIAYLYDQDASGMGTAYAVDHEPYTWLNATPGKPMTLDFDLPPQAYDIPAGHRLSLVIGTQDVLYADANQVGEPLTISSPAGDPAYLTVPSGS